MHTSAHPVGSLYWSSKPTDPATLFGGTWKQIKDVFVLACGDTYTNEETGGNATITLTTDNLPSHSHGKGTLSINSAGEHNHRHDSGLGNDGYFNAGSSGNASIGNRTLTTSSAGNHTHTITGNTASTGSGKAFSNMPPYIGKYCWERVS